jgi:hypothetical protein
MPESCCTLSSPIGAAPSSVVNTKLWPSASPLGESWLGHTWSSGREQAAGPPRDSGSSPPPPRPASSHLWLPLLPPPPPESLRFPALTAVQSFLSPRSLSGIWGTNEQASKPSNTDAFPWYYLCQQGVHFLETEFVFINGGHPVFISNPFLQRWGEHT